jgi:hypothetical protein
LDPESSPDVWLVSDLATEQPQRYRISFGDVREIDEVRSKNGAVASVEGAPSPVAIEGLTAGCIRDLAQAKVIALATGPEAIDGLSRPAATADTPKVDAKKPVLVEPNPEPEPKVEPVRPTSTRGERPAPKDDAILEDN